MRLCQYGILAILLATLAACATQQPAPNVRSQPLYSKQETLMLTMCEAMADTAASIAQRKVDNVPIEEAKKLFESTGDASMKEFQLATVDKVYSETVTSWWDYGVSFFDECALNLAQVPADRARSANHCMQNTFVADLAYGFRIQGTSKEEASARLARAGIQGSVPTVILDRVYARKEERAPLMLDIWNACIAQFSAKP